MDVYGLNYKLRQRLSALLFALASTSTARVGVDFAVKPAHKFID